MLFNKLKKLFFFIFISIFCIGCTSESAENIYPTNDAEAKVYYDANLKPIIDTKCITCHNYHLEGTNRYDSYEKTKSSIGQMIERINVASNISMPPDGSSQLSTEEKQIFQEFFDILISGAPPVTPQIALTWTAYKFPVFEERSGVSGTFDQIEYKFNDDYDDFIDILDDAEVMINTSSVNIDGADGVKSINLKTGFFAFFTPTITGTVVSYTNTQAEISFEMNSVSQNITFDITISDDTLTLNGVIPDMNFFNWTEAYDELDAVCGDAHENKVWPDVILKLEIPITQ